MSNKIFIAVAWPYSNGDLHLGNVAGAFLAPDIMARYHRLNGDDVLMVSGSDMHGTPIMITAEKERTTPEETALKYHRSHLENLNKLGISFNLYTTTTTKNHKDILQKLFIDLNKKKLVFRDWIEEFYSEKEKKFLLDRYIEGECPYCGNKSARGDQCDSCKRTLTPTELINPISKYGDKNLELKRSEHYFLDLNRLQSEVEKWLDNHPNVSNWKKHVVEFTKGWLKEGLKPRSVTRDLNYGVPLPEEMDLDDKENKVFYVWVDGVTGYWSAAVEWDSIVNEKEEVSKDVIFNQFKGQDKDWMSWWMNKDSKHYYFMGKDNIPFHTIIWPAMLIGWNKGRKETEQMQLPYDVPANQYLNLEGRKFSKSKNWYIETSYLVDTYGADLCRYYLVSRMPENRDSDFNWQDFVNVNNNELVANLGNFIHRTLSFIKANFNGKVPEGKLDKEVHFEIRDAYNKTEEFIKSVKMGKALNSMMGLSAFGNKYFDHSEVWKVVKEDKKVAGNIIYNCVQLINALRVLIVPFIPDAAEKLSKMLGLDPQSECIKVGKDCWKFEKIKAGAIIKEPKPLFEKLEQEVVEMERGKLGVNKNDQ